MAPQTLVWTLFPVLLLGLGGSSHTSLLKVNKGLKVKRGQTAFLQEGDLQFNIPRQKDACKLEVVLNEPISQRVGKLLPEVTEQTSFKSLIVTTVRSGCVCYGGQWVTDLPLFFCRCLTVIICQMRSSMSTTAARCYRRTLSSSDCTGIVQRSLMLLSLSQQYDQLYVCAGSLRRRHTWRCSPSTWTLSSLTAAS